jgi:hypothetical protein
MVIEVRQSDIDLRMAVKAYTVSGGKDRIAH